MFVFKVVPRIRALLGSAAIAAAVTIAGGTAHAGPVLSIVPASGEQDAIDDLGGNVPPAGLPLNLSGYTSESWAAGTPHLVAGPNLMAGGAGNYAFTYLGKGNATNHDTITITVPGGATVHFDNTTTPLFTTANLLATGAGEITFTYTDITTGAAISDSPSVATNTFNASYLLGIAGSTNCTDTTDPNVSGCNGLGSPLTSGGVAYVGLSDLPWNNVGDHDYQDLGVRVAAPEPITLSVLGVGLVGLLAARKRRLPR
jgi:hypothetical protein